MVEASTNGQSASFKTTKANPSTFCVQEQDAFGELPLIYVKLSDKAPVCIISDTGCDRPSKEHERGKMTSFRRWIAINHKTAYLLETDHYIHLRDYIENCPLELHDGSPINPNGARKYVIICSHCHYDHICGISQFGTNADGSPCDIIASAEGRSFVENDLPEHSLCDFMGVKTPSYTVTHWARPMQQLHWPVSKSKDPDAPPNGGIDLRISFLPLRGHTPDSLAWIDHEEMHIFVGDAFYEEGRQGMPVIWPPQGSMVDWEESVSSLSYLVRCSGGGSGLASEPGEGGEWVHVDRRWKIGCGHQTAAADGEEILKSLESYWERLVQGEIPLVSSQERYGGDCGLLEGSWGQREVLVQSTAALDRGVSEESVDGSL